MLARSVTTLNLRTVFAGALLVLAGMAASADEAKVQPQAGEMAPAISLPDQTGKTVNLSDYKGKWVVLYFYPKDQTPGCTTQACEFRDNIFAFRNAGAQILGVSVDDVASHKEFAEKHGLPFPLLADSKKESATRYGVLTKFGDMVIAARETFLIDPSGRIVKHYTVGKDDLVGHSKAVLADIETFKAAAKKG
jgi:thioredoxin-dependent peroxiredoxin